MPEEGFQPGKEEIDYLIDNYFHLLTPREAVCLKVLSGVHSSPMQTIVRRLNPKRHRAIIRIQSLLDVGRKRAREVVDAGEVNYRSALAQSIIRRHGSDIVWNRCPICSGLARTPRARQCRHCFHDWH